MRNEIYSQYLTVRDGYTYDFEAGKLRANGRPIDLALMYTCRLVASEMRGLALRLNTVVFRTLYGDELRTRAGRWSCAFSSPLPQTTPPASTSPAPLSVASFHPSTAASLAPPAAWTGNPS